jgi:Holliday junction resolvasome RuvABC endonuclease subunit
VSTVIGIDPSLSSTGIAILRDGQPTLPTTIGHHSRNGSSYAHRSDRIVSQTRAVIEAIRNHTPAGGYDLAVIEGPAYAHHNAYTHDGAGLWWGIYSALRAKRIPIAVIAPQTRAKWATGKGNASKALVLATVRSWWPNVAVRNDDEADALILAAVGAHHLGDVMPFVVKERHSAALENVDWPEVVA